MIENMRARLKISDFTYTRELQTVGNLRYISAIVKKTELLQPEKLLSRPRGLKFLLSTLILGEVDAIRNTITAHLLHRSASSPSLPWRPSLWHQDYHHPNSTQMRLTARSPTPEVL